MGASQGLTVYEHLGGSYTCPRVDFIYVRSYMCPYTDMFIYERPYMNVHIWAHIWTKWFICVYTYRCISWFGIWAPIGANIVQYTGLGFPDHVSWPYFGHAVPIWSPYMGVHIWTPIWLFMYGRQYMYTPMCACELLLSFVPTLVVLQTRSDSI